MNRTFQNKKFILEYYEAMSSQEFSEELVRRYISDEKLIAHILFFKKTFPDYTGELKEIIAEGDRVFVKINFRGTYQGDLGGVPPTLRKFTAPFAICYRVENRKIIDHWMIADQMDLLEQLGLLNDGL
ncbi:MAG: ester cyclase [Saprospiraceae bacterium]